MRRVHGALMRNGPRFQRDTPFLAHCDAPPVTFAPVLVVLHRTVLVFAGVFGPVLRHAVLHQPLLLCVFLQLPLLGRCREDTSMKFCGVYGTVSGVVAASVVLAACHALAVPLVSGVVLALTSVLAYGVAAGLIDGMRFQFNVQQYNRERKREEWELENFPQGEKEEVRGGGASSVEFMVMGS